MDGGLVLCGGGRQVDGGFGKRGWRGAVAEARMMGLGVSACGQSGETGGRG